MNVLQPSVNLNSAGGPNLDPRSGGIIKLDKNNLKIKYVTEHNSGKKPAENDDFSEAQKFKSASNNDSSGPTPNPSKNKINIVSSIQKKEQNKMQNLIAGIR